MGLEIRHQDPTVQIIGGWGLHILLAVGGGAFAGAAAHGEPWALPVGSVMLVLSWGFRFAIWRMIADELAAKRLPGKVYALTCWSVTLWGAAGCVPSTLYPWIWSTKGSLSRGQTAIVVATGAGVLAAAVAIEALVRRAVRAPSVERGG